MRRPPLWLLSCSLLLAAAASAQTPVWESAGGPASGFTYALASDSENVYVISESDLHRSDDAGRNWSRIGTPLLDMVSVSASASGVLAIHSTIVCTTEGEGACEQEGAYLSDDGGASWTPIVLPEAETLVWDLAGGAGSRVFAASGAALYRTDDGGASWALALEGPDAVAEVLANAAGFVVVPTHAAGTSEDVLYVSADNGASWNVQAVPDEVATSGYGSHLTLSPSGSLLADSRAGTRLFRSDDAGASWQPLPYPASCAATPYCGPHRVAFDPAGGVWASFATPTQAYPPSIFHTTDGDSWDETAIAHLSPLSLLVTPEGPLAATARGIFRYEDGDWRPSSGGLMSSRVQDLQVGPDGALYSASFEGDLSRLDPDTDEWTPLPFLSGARAVLPDRSGTLWAGTLSTPGLWRLSADGSEWEPIGLRNVEGLHQTEAGSLLARARPSSPYVARSTDGGDTWNEVLSLDAFDLLERDGVLYVASREGVYGSTDDGQTWNSVGLEGVTVGRLAEADGTLWASSPDDGLLRRRAGQVEWEAVGSPADDAPLYDAFAISGAVYLSTRGAVYRSTDGGATWEAWTSGLPEDAAFRALTVGPGGHLYAGAWGQSVYRTTEPVTATSSAPPPATHAFALSRPRPNPTSGQATLSLHTTAPAHVRVGLYDLLGREVAVVLDRALAPGRHAVRVDAERLPAGVYVVQARTEGHSPRVAQQRIVVTR